MDIKTLCIYIVLFVQDWCVFANGLSVQIGNVPTCDPCDNNRTCHVKTYHKVHGNSLIVRLEPLCPLCRCTLQVVSLWKCVGSDFFRHSDKHLYKWMDREVVFSDLEEGRYRLKVIRGLIVSNMQECFEVSNHVHEKNNTAKYLVISGCGLFSTMVLVGMIVVSLKWPLRNGGGRRNIRHFPLNNSVSPKQTYI